MLRMESLRCAHFMHASALIEHSQQGMTVSIFCRQVLNLSGNERLEVPPFAPADLPQLVELHVDAHLQGWGGMHGSQGS